MLIDSFLPYVPNPACFDHVTKVVSRSQESCHLASPFLLVSQQRPQGLYDKNRKRAMFSAGELVLVWKPNRKVGLFEKLLRSFFGPYRVLRQTSP